MTGTYSVSLTVTGDGGTDTETKTDYVTVADPTNTVEDEINEHFRIFPNPTNDMLAIETDSPDKYIMEITSLNGQLMYIKKIEGLTHQIDLSSFEKGLYSITVRSRDYVRTEKIIKQ